MDNLYRHLLTVVMNRNWAHGLPAAVGVVFEVTGTLPVEQEVSTY
jgi:hypothetical protein